MNNINDFIEKGLIKFEERYDDAEIKITELYFTAPKELLNGDYPEAEHSTIRVDIPMGLPRAMFLKSVYAEVHLSPTKYVEEDDCYRDYDWSDIEISCNDTDELIRLVPSFQKISDERKIELYDLMLSHLIECCSSEDLPDVLHGIGFTDEEIRVEGLECPLGGDTNNDCADCFYAGDYHFVDGDCVERK